MTWPLDVVGEGVVLGGRCHWCHWWVVCCCPAIVVAWLSSVVVVVVVSHHCRRSWLLTWTPTDLSLGIVKFDIIFLKATMLDG